MPWQNVTGDINVELYNLTSPVSVPVNAGVVTAANLLPIPQYSGFDVSLSAHCPTQNTAGAAFAIQLVLQWYSDPQGNNLVYQEKWYPWVGSTANVNRAMGSGPMHGLYMTAGILNPLGTETIIVDGFTLSGNSKQYPYTSFRQSVPDVVCNGATSLPASGNGFIDGFDNFLGSLNNVTPGTGLQFVPLPFYAGPVDVYWSVNTAALVNAPTLIDMTQAVSGSLAPGTGQQGLIIGLTNTINTSEFLNMIFPRKPVALIVNPASTSQLQFSAIAQQGF